VFYAEGMSRKYDRHKRELSAGFEILKGSLRQQPWWLPWFIWRPVQALALKIAFK
jgi:hypothetical protein